MKNIWGYGILASCSVAFYLLILGIWSCHPGTSESFAFVGLWHPVLMSFFGIIASAIFSIIMYEGNDCSACHRLTENLKNTEQKLAKTEDALRELHVK